MLRESTLEMVDLLRYYFSIYQRTSQVNDILKFDQSWSEDHVYATERAVNENYFQNAIRSQTVKKCGFRGGELGKSQATASYSEVMAGM